MVLRPRATVLQKPKNLFGPRLVLFRMYGPDGRECVFRRRKVWTDTGRAVVEYRIDYNETPGKYRITARDVMTGHEAQTTFEVIPR